MTSTSEFFDATASLTVHKPPGQHEAVLMIATMDSVASITLSSDDAKRLAAALLADVTACDEPESADP